MLNRDPHFKFIRIILENTYVKLKCIEFVHDHIKVNDILLLNVVSASHAT